MMAGLRPKIRATKRTRAKVKKAEGELKKQRDDLGRFRRFLPTLMLKKQQLQVEIHRVEQLILQKKWEHKQQHLQQKAEFPMKHYNQD